MIGSRPAACARVCVCVQLIPMGETELSNGMHGTVSHMPPEAMKRPTSFTLLTDVYSFGVVLWEMYTQVGGMAGMLLLHDGPLGSVGWRAARAS